MNRRFIAVTLFVASFAGAACAMPVSLNEGADTAMVDWAGDSLPAVHEAEPPQVAIGRTDDLSAAEQGAPSGTPVSDALVMELFRARQAAAQAPAVPSATQHVPTEDPSTAGAGGRRLRTVARCPSIRRIDCLARA